MTMRFAIALLTALVCLPAPAQFRPDHRFAISTGTIAGAIVKSLLERGIAIDEEQISTLTNVVATQPTPALDVQSVSPRQSFTRGAQSIVKLACRTPYACLPFYAVIDWPAGRTPPPMALDVSTTARASAHSAPVLMRAGTHATLALGDGRADIHVSVISLENGALGRRIRVATPNRKVTYTAEVVSADTLKGTF